MATRKNLTTSPARSSGRAPDSPLERAHRLLDGGEHHLQAGRGAGAELLLVAIVLGLVAARFTAGLGGSLLRRGFDRHPPQKLLRERQAGPFGDAFQLLERWDERGGGDDLR